MNFNIKVVGRHLLAETGQGLVLINTGSTNSFHNDGVIIIEKHEYPVPQQLLLYDASVVSQYIGCEVTGVIGMDILKNYDAWITISPEREDGFIIGGFWFKEVKYPGAINIKGLTCFDLEVNGRTARMLFDTGARISYIKKEFTEGRQMVGRTQDFFPPVITSPTDPEDDYCFADMYNLPVEFFGDRHNIMFGIMPRRTKACLSQFNIDGIIGYDLLKYYRVAINQGILHFPCQGI